MRRTLRTLALFSVLMMSASPAFAGATDGQTRHVDVVRAHHTDIFRISFDGRERAIVAVSGDGDTDLDCRIYDENDNLVDSDTDATDECRLTFVPRWTGRFRLEIKNLGSVSNRYVILTN
ncbi:MAG: hypothetical protein CVU56_26295 [Deltaproteobacteria bacterium HGW-Deltaproteobacteria-14]|jgi:hypothetical protein|nr:MAG: hypothetical protein CVU56_26295 [Deltaproteobacteria bacterium HGW-Deltaproteobacteria-14]